MIFNKLSKNVIYFHTHISTFFSNRFYKRYYYIWVALKYCPFDQVIPETSDKLVKARWLDVNTSLPFVSLIPNINFSYVYLKQYWASETEYVN